MNEIRQAVGYAGDITPQTAHEWMRSGTAKLVDIRSHAERAWVGFVEGSCDIEWKSWPGMIANPNFDVEIQAAAPAGTKLMFLCRSGVRSIAAAKVAQALGYAAYNILEGFEGDPDSAAHRGLIGGWKFGGLPWKQN